MAALERNMQLKASMMVVPSGRVHIFALPSLITIHTLVSFLIIIYLLKYIFPCVSFRCCNIIWKKRSKNISAVVVDPALLGYLSAEKPQADFALVVYKFLVILLLYTCEWRNGGTIQRDFLCIALEK